MNVRERSVIEGAGSGLPNEYDAAGVLDLRRLEHDELGPRSLLPLAPLVCGISNPEVELVDEKPVTRTSTVPDDDDHAPDHALRDVPLCDELSRNAIAPRVTAR